MAFDKSKFIEGFKTEARDHIQKLNLGLLKLEKAPLDKALLEELMREAHTIKGSSTMMGYKRIAEIAHRMEDGLEAAMNGAFKLKKDHFDIFLEALDVISALLEDKVTWEGKGLDRPFIEGLCKKIDALISGAAPTKADDGEIAPAGDSPAKSGHPEPARKPEVDSAAGSSAVSAEEAVRVDINRLNKLVNISGELLLSKIRLSEVTKNLIKKSESSIEIKTICGEAIKDLSGVSNNIDALTSTMQEEVMKVRMVPVAYLFNTFPRSMRDLANEKGKDIEFRIQGEETLTLSP